jgi:hypothetical protein
MRGHPVIADGAVEDGCLKGGASLRIFGQCQVNFSKLFSFTEPLV